MFKIKTDRTKILKFGPQPRQIGERFEGLIWGVARVCIDKWTEYCTRTNAMRCVTEVLNGKDNVLRRPRIQGDNDNLVRPRRVRERDPIKGRQADLIIIDDVTPDAPCDAELNEELTHAPTNKRNTIDADDYIQLRLT